jgi:hypothetical protein
MKGCVEKTLPLSCPPELTAATASVETYPKSVRMAKGLYEVSMPILRENGLVLPRFIYESTLHFSPGNEPEGYVRYEKWSLRSDKLQVKTITDGTERCVEVVRMRGARFIRNTIKTQASLFWYADLSDMMDAMFGKYPAFTGVFAADGSFTGYNLLSNNLAVKRSSHS